MAREQRLGPYRIVSLLGEGGMGRAYRAIHEPLDRVVALKVLHPRVLDDPECRARFQREMRIAAALAHRGVVKVYDGGTHDGIDYLAMELVPGDTLDAHADRTPGAPWTYWVAVAASVADSLAYLHAQGIVHRDLKHGNVKITPSGDVKILDFGLARALDSTALTGQDCWVGTYRYIAPEVLFGEPATPGADLWSLGVMLHELLSSSKFLADKSLNGFAQSVVNDPLPPIGEGLGVPPEVVAFVMKLLEREPSRRLASARVVADELAKLLVDAGATTVEDALRAGSRAARPRSSTRPRASTAETQKMRPRGYRRRAVLAVALSAGVLVALAVALVTPASAPRIEQRGVVPHVSASAPADALALTRTARWLAVDEQSARLKAGRAFAHRAMRDLRARTELDLGEDPEVWLHWVALGRWLEAPAGAPPRWSGAVSGPPSTAHDELFSTLINPYLYADASSHAVYGLRMTIEWPDDGRGWLVLGRVLELEGREAAARAVYAVALERFDAAHMHSKPEIIWCALARALSYAPGRNLVSAWLAAVASGTNPDKAWRGARAAFVDAAPAVYEQLLVAGSTDAMSGEAASCQLGRFYLKVKRDPPRALAALAAGARRFPASVELENDVVAFHLERGDLAGAVPWLAGARARARWQSVLARLREDEVAAGPCAGGTAAVDPDNALFAALGALERGCATEAEALAVRVPAHDDDEREDRLPLLLELLSAGQRTGWVVEECRALLARRKAGWEAWAAAAGALSSRAGEPWMELLLEQAEARYPKAWAPKLARALWLARSGRHAAAIAQLERVPGRGSSELPPEAVCEVLTRPAWAAALGDAAARDAAAAALRAPGPPGGGPAARYLAHVRAGRLDAAAALAEGELAVDPGEPVWALAAYAYGSLPGAPERWRQSKARIRFGLRASPTCSWLVRETRAIDRRVKAP